MKHEMQDASMLWLGGLGGCVKQERPHEERFTGEGEANGFAVLRDDAGDSVRGDGAELMRAGRNPERAVRFIAIVEVKADGEEFVEGGVGRLREVVSILDGGAAVSWGLGRVGDGKHEVLMPGDLPVGDGGFIEGDGLDGDGTRWEDACLMECFAQTGGGLGNRRPI
jgi:hypothetical protein